MTIQACRRAVVSATLVRWPLRARSTSRPQVPGPRSARCSTASSRERRLAARDHVPRRRRRRARRHDHRRRRQHLHRLRGRRRLPERRPLAPARRRRRRRSSSSASATPTSRSSRTRTTPTLAERLLARAPIGGPTKAAFFNAGTEAVENAVKFARAFTGRQAVIAFEGAFHGRTLLSLSLTSKTHPYKAGLGPFAPEVYRVPFPNAYRGPTAEEALAALRRAFSTLVAAENVAAIVFEPVQGEGGFIPAPTRVRRGPARDLRRARDRPGLRRGADRLRAHRAASSRSSTSASSPT